jgi:anti-sigma B factor antagonist
MVACGEARLWRDRFAAVIDFGLVDETVDESTHVVTLRGEIDAHTAPRLGSRLFGLAEDGARAVVVDLSHVTFMDSTGIGVLLNALRHLSLRRCRMVLVCPTERVMRPFEITGLVGHLTIFDSREKALGCFA